VIQLLHGIVIVRIHRAEADQLFRVPLHIAGDILVRNHVADVMGAKAEDDSPVHRTHGCPMLVQVYHQLLRRVSAGRARIGYELGADVRSIANVRVAIYDQERSPRSAYRTPYLR
jgi:hypothetical protein